MTSGTKTTKTTTYETFDGLAALKEMRLNEGVLYTSASLVDVQILEAAPPVAFFSDGRYWIARSTWGKNGFCCRRIPASFDTEAILATDWHVYGVDERDVKLSDTFSKLAREAALNPDQGPEYARGLLHAAVVAEERGL